MFKMQITMKKHTLILCLIASFCLGSYFMSLYAKQNPINTKEENNIKVGAFSISLNVKDVNASKSFYESLGFTAFAGGKEKNYYIMKNGNALIGIFQGMFKGNMLTFNPGWDENAKNIESFDDIRIIQKHLKSKGLTINLEADEKSTGPASCMVTDPDGNIILFDQHR